jgi:hypothetical protein
MRTHSAADCNTLSLAFISDVILFSQGPPAVQSTNCGGLTLEESYLDSDWRCFHWELASSTSARLVGKLIDYCRKKNNTRLYVVSL